MAREIPATSSTRRGRARSRSESEKAVIPTSPALETRGPGLNAILLLVAIATIVWVRMLPLSLGGLDLFAGDAAMSTLRGELERTLEPGLSGQELDAAVDRQMPRWLEQHRQEFDQLRKEFIVEYRGHFLYPGEDGRQHALLGDLDSYHWLRMAHNYLVKGTSCDEVLSNGECRDTLANAPVGRRNIYYQSAHIAAIVLLHRLITLVKPHYPLAATSFLVPVIVGASGAIPAFAIGLELGGAWSGFFAALLVGLSPIVLTRTLGSDDDVWSVVLPLWILWAILKALRSEATSRRILYAVLAALIMEVQIVTWNGWVFFYSVILAGLAAGAALSGAGAAWSHRDFRIWRYPEVKRIAIVTGVMVATTVVCAIVFDHSSRPWIFKWFAWSSSPLPAASPAKATVFFPDEFSTVTELARGGRADIFAEIGGQAFFVLAWLGLCSMFLPAGKRIQSHLLALIMVGLCLAVYGLAGTYIGPKTFVTMLALPPAVLMAADFYSTEVLSVEDLAFKLIVAAWFLGSVLAAFRGIRFVLLTPVPLAIAYAYLVGHFRPLLKGWNALAALTLATVALLPIAQGYSVARSYLPLIDDAWWGELTSLREKSPTNSIITLWWDRAYWAKYLAERRVSADGGSLRTHIPFWVAKAIVTPDEVQSVGLLRMLDCGSDATPEPEESLGAFGKLIRNGVDPTRAIFVIQDLARLNAAKAGDYLANLGIGVEGRVDILKSTHCSPPPAYLITYTAMTQQPGLLYNGTWDVGRAFIVNRSKSLPEPQAVDELVQKLGYSKPDAEELYRQAQAIRPGYQTRRFLAPSAPFVTPNWAPCRSSDSSGGQFTCKVDADTGPQTVLDRVVLYPAEPARSRLVFRQTSLGGGSRDEEVAPAMVLAAEPDGLEEVQPDPTERSSEIAILMDPSGPRVLLALPNLLRSTLTQLLFLGGRYTKLFEKVDSRVGHHGQVITWKINWNAPQ